MEKLQLLCKERMVRFETFFEMFDRQKNKTITKAEFVRALSIAGIRITEAEADELCKQYQSKAYPDKVRYLDLSDEVNTVLTVKNLEKAHPGSPVTTASVPRSPARMGLETSEEIVAMKAAMDRVLHHANVHGISVKSFFSDFDKNNCGAIPQEEFVRCLKGLDGGINSEQAFALAKAYSKKQANGMVLVSYRELHADATNEAAQKGASYHRLTRKEEPDPGHKYERPHWYQSQDQQGMEDQLATYLAQRRVGRGTASQYYMSYDKFRTGTCPLSNFKQGCRLLFETVPFTEKMLRGLAEYYAAPGTGNVSYVDFLNSLFGKLRDAGTSAAGGDTWDMSGFHGTPETVHKPKHGLGDDHLGPWGGGGGAAFKAFKAAGTAVRGSVALRKRRGSQALYDDVEPAAVSPKQHVIGGHSAIVGDKIGDRARRNSMSLNSPIARTRNISQDYQNALHEEALHARASGGGGGARRTAGGRVASNQSVLSNESQSSPFYRAGLESFGDPSRLGLGTSRALGFKDAVPLRPGEARQAARIMSRIKSAVRVKRLDLKWRMHDFDVRGSSTSTQHEHITASQFTRCLMDLELLDRAKMDEEAGLLVRRYAPTDGRHEPKKFVNYRRFLFDVDESYAQQQLHGGSVRLDGECEATLKAPRKTDPLRNQLELLAISPSHAIGGPARGAQAVFDGVVEHCATQRVRLADWLGDGDPLRKGVLNRHRFRTGLASAGVKLSDAEFGALADRFAAPPSAGKDAAGLGLVAWQRFMREVKLGLGEGDDAVDTALTQSRMSRSGFGGFGGLADEGAGAGGAGAGGPAVGTPPSPSRRLSGLTSRGDLNEEVDAANAVEEVARLCSTRRLDIRHAFKDFDRQNRGVVSAAVFDRCLTLCGVRPADPAAMRGLLRKFADTTHDSRLDVHYKAFVDAVAGVAAGDQDAFHVHGAGQFRAKTRGRAPTRGNLDEYAHRTLVDPASRQAPEPTGCVTGVLLELAAQLRQRNSRLVDFLQDGDVLGSGEVSHFKFRSALERSGLRVDDQMFAELTAAYGSSKRRAEMVDWRKFHAALNEAKAHLKDEAVGSPLGGRKRRTSTGGDTQTPMEVLLDAFAEVVTSRRLLVKPFFQDLDRCRENSVTKAQMASVMSQNVGLELTNEERDLLFQAFRVYDGKGNATNRFDYKKFVQRIDDSETS